MNWLFGPIFSIPEKSDFRVIPSEKGKSRSYKIRLMSRKLVWEKY